jgi:hypothetical protein
VEGCVVWRTVLVTYLTELRRCVGLVNRASNRYVLKNRLWLKLVYRIFSCILTWANENDETCYERRCSPHVIIVVLQSSYTYEVVFKIFWTGAAIYTVVVVARSTGPNRPNCEFRFLLRCFAATAWKRAKTLPRTLARTDLAASPWQRPVSRFLSHPAFSGETPQGCHPHPPYSPDLAPCDFFLFTKMKLKLKGCRFDTIKEIKTESQRVVDTLREKYFQETFQNWRRRWDRYLHAGENNLEGDGGR